MSLYGPSWPLKNGEKDLFQMNDDLKSQIKFELKNLLLTSKGENISNVDYGVGIRRYLFEQNIESTRQSIILNISEQVKKFMPYIRLNKISVTASPTDIDSNSLSIKIDYSIPRKIEQDIFEINVKPETLTGFF
tara:strand:+ start:10515 stop:10916 length:402 start_codon:yes stop_codon:yes gene_type:complete